MRSVVFPPRPAKIVRLAALACVFVASAAAPPASEATPQFARQHQLRCTACHLVPPRLNEDGLDFQASGYRLSDQLRRQRRVEADAPGFATFPFAAWITGRFDDQGSGGASDLLLPKVELISGGTLGEQWSYFAEWRIVSLSLNSDGSLKDRGGRFEDLFVQRNFGTRHALRVGQYRALNQVDVSLRLSPSEPLLFKNGLRTGRDPDARINSLLQFSPSSRSPSIGYAFQSVAGDRASDGLFHYVTLPFVGEFSIPLSSEASKTASFELQGPPKGVFVETFYRTGQKSLGGHVFYDEGAWLATALGTYNWRSVLVTARLGVDDQDDGVSRRRSSLEVEYFVTGQSDLRAAAGLRMEEVSDDGQRAAYVPYFVLAGPNTQHTFLLQLQYKVQQGSDAFVVDLSMLF